MRLLLVVLAALTLEGCQEAEASSRRCRRDRLGRLTGCDPAPTTTAAASYSFCAAALVAGNRVGTWGCVNGDGTAPAGDNLGPWVVSGSPSSTSGTTCAAPSYKTFNGATPDYVISTASIGAVPPAFTICGAYLLTSSAAFAPFAWEAGLGSFYTLVSEQSVVLLMYPNSPSTLSTLQTISTGDKVLICYSYAGGSQHAYIKSLGGSFNTYVSNSTTAPVLGAGGQKIIWGADSTSYTLNGNFYGGFYTEKDLGQSDLDAVFAAVIGDSCS
jgi:hypothetical protein